VNVSPPGRAGGSIADADLLRALRRGDEAAFASLVQTHTPRMLRVAAAYVPTRAAAEDVVQETWLALVRGLAGFRAESRLTTWLFRVLVNIARTRGPQERRVTPFSSLSGANPDGGPAVDPDRFLPADDPHWPGHWSDPPHPWDSVPEERLLSAETLARVRAALELLPARQRDVVSLRDVAGLTADEVCAMLDLTPANQRVLLHRGRSRIRAALEEYLEAPR
jgi:RNA polymerase sigma-70 factor (ECF subfamily)